MKLDVSSCAMGLIVPHMVLTALQLFGFLFCLSYPVGSARGSATYLGYLIFQLFNPKAFADDYDIQKNHIRLLVPAQIVGSIFYVLLYVWVKPYYYLCLLLFRIISNLYHQWNVRVLTVLMQGRTAYTKKNRTTISLMFKV